MSRNAILKKCQLFLWFRIHLLGIKYYRLTVQSVNPHWIQWESSTGQVSLQSCTPLNGKHHWTQWDVLLSRHAYNCTSNVSLMKAWHCMFTLGCILSRYGIPITQMYKASYYAFIHNTHQFIEAAKEQSCGILIRQEAKTKLKKTWSFSATK